jgi:hypothetical protein
VKFRGEKFQKKLGLALRHAGLKLMVLEALAEGRDHRSMGPALRHWEEFQKQDPKLRRLIPLPPPNSLCPASLRPRKLQATHSCLFAIFVDMPFLREVTGIDEAPCSRVHMPAFRGGIKIGDVPQFE